MLDVQAINVFGKEDSISTIQVDFNLPERFDISFIDKDGQKKRPSAANGRGGGLRRGRGAQPVGALGAVLEVSAHRRVAARACCSADGCNPHGICLSREYSTV